MPAKNTCYRTTQVAYLRQHYQDLPPAHFADLFGVSVSKVYRLAQRNAIRKRAPNGQPVWRPAA